MDSKSIPPDLAAEIARLIGEQLKSDQLVEQLADAVLKKLEGRVPGPKPASEPVPTAQPPKPKPVASPPPAPEIPEHHLALIFAAVATVVGKPIKIRDIAIVAPSSYNTWGTQGRISIQRSHVRLSQEW